VRCRANLRPLRRAADEAFTGRAWEEEMGVYAGTPERVPATTMPRNTNMGNLEGRNAKEAAMPNIEDRKVCSFIPEFCLLHP
jgi:hypothetical protein